MAQPPGGDGNGGPFEAAWKALWTEDGPYHLPQLLTRRVRARGVELAPLTELSLPPTGSIKLLRKDPWGIVALEMEALALSGLSLVEPIGFTHHPGSSQVSAELAFGGLMLSGRWRVDTGGTLSPAARTMIDQVVQRRHAIKTAAASLGDSQDAGLTQAVGYRAQLARTSNGSKMVGAYYDNNDAYHEIMATHLMTYNWTSHQTNGQTTSFYAQQTVAATAAGATQPVNGQPDSQGYSPYNAHALFMGTAVMNMAYYLADNTYKNNPTKAQQMQAAGDASASFSTTTTPLSQTPQPASNVMSTVANSQPPAAAMLVRRAESAVGMRDPIALLERDDDPQWKKDVYAHVRRVFAEWGDPTQPRPDKQPLGGEYAKREQLDGVFAHEFPRFAVTLTGQLPEPGGSAPPVFTGMRVRIPEPHFVLLTPDSNASPLQDEVQRALEAAGFLRSVLRHRIETRLRTGGLLHHLSTALQLAIAGALGPLR